MMSSSTEDTAVAAPSTATTTTASTENDVDEETKMLLHDDRSSIFEARIRCADLCRQRGSTCFNDSNKEKAVEWYQRTLYHVDFDEGSWHFEFTAKNRADVNEVRLPVYLNLAACFLLQGAPMEGEKDQELLAQVVKHVDLALAIDPENDKALYRGGRALLLMGELEGAKEKLTKAAKQHPINRNIREAMVALKAKLAEHKQEEKERWGGRLLDDEKGIDRSKTASIVQQQQLKESSNTLWMFVVVLMAIALALGQLSFVE